MKDKKKIEEDKLKKAAGGIVVLGAARMETVEPAEGEDDGQKFINIDGARP